MKTIFKNKAVESVDKVQHNESHYEYVVYLRDGFTFASGNRVDAFSTVAEFKAATIIKQ